MTNRTKVFVAVVLLGAVGGSAALWHARFAADFYPPDRSFVGPNLVASVIQAIIVFLAAVLLYPPFRRAMEQVAHRANVELHEKLDRNFAAAKHIAKHSPDIPDLGDDGHTHPDWTPPPVKAAATRKKAT